MKLRATWVALAVVVLAAGGAFAWLGIGKAQERSRVRKQLLEAVAIDLAREPLDRGEVQGLATRLAAAAKEDPDDRLTIARARVEHALGRTQAWDTLAELATRVDAPPEALLLGAQILAAAHALSGRAETASRAIGLAERHHQATGSPESLLLAWQLAVRAERVQDAERVANELRTSHPDSPHARLLQSLQAFASDPAAARRQLTALAEELRPPPEELEAALASYDVASDDSAARQNAVERLERLLAVVPILVDARNFAAVGWLQLERPERAVPHLRWLVERGPQGDERRATWEQLLQAHTR